MPKKMRCTAPSPQKMCQFNNRGGWCKQPEGKCPHQVKPKLTWRSIRNKTTALNANKEVKNG